MCHKLSCISTYGLMAKGREMSILPTPPRGYGMLYLCLTICTTETISTVIVSINSTIHITEDLFPLYEWRTNSRSVSGTTFWTKTCWSSRSPNGPTHPPVTTDYQDISNVIGRHQGLKQKLWAGYRALSLKRAFYLSSSSVADVIFCIVDMLQCFHCRVWNRALSLHYACTRSSGIIHIPQATFVPNFVSFAASVAELAHGEKSRTNSINRALTHLIWCSGNQSFRFGTCKYLLWWLLHKYDK